MSAVTPTRAGVVPWPAELVADFVAKGYWDGHAISDHIYAAGDATPDAVCLVDGDVRLRYRDLMSRADGAAVRLLELGLRPDDRIILQLPNCWEFVVLTVACLRAGIVPVMALPAHRQQELAFVAGLTEAVAIVVPDVYRGFDHQALAHTVAASVPSLAHVIVSGVDARPGDVDVSDLLAPAGPQARAALDAGAPAGDAVALFLLSGGTTGLPKVIARTHNDYGYMMRRAAWLCEAGPGDVYLAVLPLGHGFPMSGPGVLGLLSVGGSVVIAASPEPDRAFAAIEGHRATITSVVPAIAQRWLEYRTVHPGRDLSSLRLLQIGGSRLADEVAVRITPALGATLQQVFGMSEGLLCLTRPDDPPEVILTSQGRPICPDDELLLVDENGQPTASGEPGVLLTRGPYTPRGYYRSEAQGTAPFDDGWYRTGDIVRLRPDGNLVIEGRDKDVINRGGEKIPAEEVESYAYRVGGVLMAAAVAMPDPELGERICLYVVPYPGNTVHLSDIHMVMQSSGVARYKFPERLVLTSALPTTNVGKIDKKLLRADIARKLAAEDATPLAS